MKLQFVNLGERLRTLRRNARKSQRQLAREFRAIDLPITRDMIAKWETNRTEMSARWIPFLAHALKGEVADLLPDLRTSPSANPQRISATKSAQAPRSASQPTRAISEPAKARCHANGVKAAFLAENDLSPLDALILSETRVKLMTLVRSLEHRQRHVLLLRYYSGLKTRQIAARLNLPISNVQARLHRACESLRRLLYFHPKLRSLREELRDQFPPLEES